MHRTLVLALALAVLAACNADKKKSVQRTNEGVAMVEKGNWDPAITRLTEATNAYKENHTAWYNLGLAYEGKKDYQKAAEAFEKAAKLRDKDPMYHMMLGVMLYELEIERARALTAGNLNKPIKEVTDADLNLKDVSFDKARGALEESVKLNDQLYRAHHYLGRIKLYGGDEKGAAESFTASIEANARFAAPYIRLGELYRLWDLPDLAIQALKEGKNYVPNDKDRAELLFTLGMAYYDKKDYTAAATEFGDAIKADKDHHRARYQRGLSYFYLSNFAEAKKDLEMARAKLTDGFMLSVIADKIHKMMAAESKESPPPGDVPPTRGPG